MLLQQRQQRQRTPPQQQQSLLQHHLLLLNVLNQRSTPSREPRPPSLISSSWLSTPPDPSSETRSPSRSPERTPNLSLRRPAQPLAYHRRRSRPEPQRRSLPLLPLTSERQSLLCPAPTRELQPKSERRQRQWRKRRLQRRGLAEPEGTQRGGSKGEGRDCLRAWPTPSSRGGQKMMRTRRGRSKKNLYSSNNNFEGNEKRFFFFFSFENSLPSLFSLSFLFTRNPSGQPPPP